MKILHLEHYTEIPDNFTGIIETPAGDKSWCKNGLLHREDGPAVEYASGDKSWYKNGLLHREDGPAVEWLHVNQYHINGKLHRIDGPAIETPDGLKDYWINDEQVTKEAQELLYFFMKLRGVL